MSSWRIAALLALLAALLYSPSLAFDFVNWDDPDYILNNPHVAQGLASFGWALTATEQFYWHPLTWISYLLDFTFFAYSPAGYHAVNIGLHALTSAIVFLSLRALTGGVWRSAMVAALFAVHPMRVESVAWIAERKDVLSGLFWFLALWSYAGWARGSRKDVWLTHLWFALGLMSKPMIVTLPVVLLALDRWPLGRKWGRSLILEKLPMVAMAAAVGTGTIIAQSAAGASAGLEDAGSGLRISNALVAYVMYVAKSFWPENLAPLYPLLPVPAWQAVGAAVVLAGIAWIAWKRAYTRSGWLWFIITLAPVIGLTQVGAQSMADRFTYIPQVGLWIAIVWGAAELSQAWKVAPRQLWSAATLILAVLAWATLTYLPYWHDSIAMWERTLAIAPVNYVAHHNLALALRAAGRRDEAAQHLNAALQIRPRFAEARSNLGGLFLEAGRPAEALAHLKQALQDNPSLASAHGNLGAAYGMLGRNPEAARELQASLALNPNQPDMHSNLGVIYESLGQIPQAIDEFQKTLALRPDHAEARKSLARLTAK